MHPSATLSRISLATRAPRLILSRNLQVCERHVPTRIEQSRSRSFRGHVHSQVRRGVAATISVFGRPDERPGQDHLGATFPDRRECSFGSFLANPWGQANTLPLGPYLRLYSPIPPGSAAWFQTSLDPLRCGSRPPRTAPRGSAAKTWSTRTAVMPTKMESVSSV